MSLFSNPELSAERAFAESIAISVRPLFRRIANVGAAFARIRERARAMNELARMTDSELNDLGLARSDLPHLFDANFQATRGF
jgi:uncharacterized protein YjiS (DUF1127 family)